MVERREWRRKIVERGEYSEGRGRKEGNTMKRLVREQKNWPEFVVKDEIIKRQRVTGRFAV